MGRKRETRQDLPERVYAKHGALYYVTPVGKWLRLGRATSFADCMRKYAELADSPRNVVTVNDLLDRYFIQIVPKKAERTQKDNATEARYLRAYFGDMPLEAVKPQHVAEYRDERKAKVRANRELALLSHAFSKGIEWGLLESNPCSAVSRNPEKPRTRYVEDEELEAFRQRVPEWMALYIDLKLATGARKQSLLSLTLSSWHEEKGLRVFMQKTGNTVVFRPTEQLVTLMRAVLAQPRLEGWLFFTRSGGRYTEAGFDSIWRRRMTKFVAEGYTRFHEHDIRGKFATDYEDAGGDAQAPLGHKNRKTTDGYVKSKKVVTVNPLGK